MEERTIHSRREIMIITPKDKCLQFLKNRDHMLTLEDHLTINFIDKHKGSGVFANSDISAGSFITIYDGELIDEKAGKKRLQEAGGGFLFFVSKFCIDASNCDNIGRYINDSVTEKSANCSIRNIPIGRRPNLCVFAKITIMMGSELLYNYGPTDEHMYWRLGQEPSFYYTIPMGHLFHGSSLTADDTQVLCLSLTADDTPVHSSSLTADDTQVLGSSLTACDTLVHGSSLTSDDTQVHGCSLTALDTQVLGSSLTADDTPVHSSSLTADDTQVHGSSLTADDTQVHGCSLTALDTQVLGSSLTADDTPVHSSSLTADDTTVLGASLTAGDTQVHGCSLTALDTQVLGSSLTADDTTVHSSSLTADDTPVHCSSLTADDTQFHGSSLTACDTLVHGSSLTADDTPVHGSSLTADDTLVHGSSLTADDRQVLGSSLSADDIMVLGSSLTVGDTLVHGSSLTADDTPVHSSSLTADDTTVLGASLTAGDTLIHGSSFTTKDTPIHGSSSEVTTRGSIVLEGKGKNKGKGIAKRRVTATVDDPPFNGLSCELTTQGSTGLVGTGKWKLEGIAKKSVTAARGFLHGEKPSSCYSIPVMETQCSKSLDGNNSQQTQVGPYQISIGSSIGSISRKAVSLPSLHETIREQNRNIITKWHSRPEQDFSDIEEIDDDKDSDFDLVAFKKGYRSSESLESDSVKSVEQAPIKKKALTKLAARKTKSSNLVSDINSIAASSVIEDEDSVQFPILEALVQGKRGIVNKQPASIKQKGVRSKSSLSKKVVAASITELGSSLPPITYHCIRPGTQFPFKNHSAALFLPPFTSTQPDIVPTSADELEESFSQKEKSYGIYKKEMPKEGKKKRYDKINFCTFCSKPMKGKISDHLLSVHMKESRLLEIRMLPLKSEERRIKLQLLSNEGNFKHNAKVLREKDGLIVVARRSSLSADGDDDDGDDCLPEEFMPCEYCLKFFHFKTLWHHIHACIIRKFLTVPLAVQNDGDEDDSSGEGDGYKNYAKRSKHLLNSAVFIGDEKELPLLLDRMNNDEVKIIITGDQLIRRYLCLEIEALGHVNDHKRKDVYTLSQKARALGRLIIEARRQLPDCTLDTLIESENFDKVVEATKNLTDLENCTNLSFGAKMGYLIGHLLAIKAGMALRANDSDGYNRTEQYKKLFEAEWNRRVNAVARKRKNNMDLAKRNDIPLTSDLVKLRKYLCQRIKFLTNRLSVFPSSSSAADDWLQLCRATLCRLLLFNKRRVTEVTDITMAAYNERPKWTDDNQEMIDSLSVMEREMARRMDLIIVAGKSVKNTHAYVLLPPDCQTAIITLLNTRSNVKVSASNKYLFARLNADTPLSGTQDLRELANECPQLEFPERITTTKLRKYIATVSQILDMKEQELSILAAHLGHDPKTHCEYYRLSSSTVELTTVTRLLLAVESGCLNTWRGQHLQDINIDAIALCAGEESVGTPFNSMTDLSELATGIASEGTTVKKVTATSTSESRDLDLESDDDEYLAAKSRRGMKRRWTPEENSVFKIAFDQHIKQSKVATTEEIEVARSSTILHSRRVAQIRVRIHNVVNKKQKMILNI